MTSPNKRLVYFDAWTDRVSAEILDGRDDIDTVCLAVVDDPAANWSELERAHGYQCLIRTEAGRHPEVGDQYFANAGLLDRCPDLLAVCSAGAGYDVIDVAACSAAGVVVCNNSGIGAEAVAEHALGFMLSLSKKIAMADRAMRREAVADRSGLRGGELRGKTLGVVGIGQIGSRLVELCAPFRMTVLAYDPPLTAEQTSQRGATKVELDVLLQRADFVLLNCPLTPETEGLIGHKEFAQMKPTAYFITTARGKVHDERALVDALIAGQIAGAGVDVFHQEPTPPDHPLLALDTVIASPHTAGITVEAARDIAIATAEQWITIFDGKVPPRLVNPEAWPRYSERFEALLGACPDELDPT